jgi:manganese transport protein
MEGFLNIRLRPWLRRLITRLIAVVPALITVVIYGEDATGDLLVLSQVILSLQLSFAVFPLVMFSTDEKRLGSLAAPVWMRVLAWPVAVIIAALNVYMLWQVFIGGSNV